MLVVGLCLVALLAVRVVHLLIDRGSREHLTWGRHQYEYFSYIAALDLRGMVIRECANTVSNSRGRARMAGITVAPLVLIVVIFSIGGLTGWSAGWVALGCALLVGALPTVEQLFLRRSGYIDYLRVYGVQQRLILVAGAAGSTALAWAGFRSLFALAFDAAPWLVGSRILGWVLALAFLALSVSVLTAAFRLSASRDTPGFGARTDPSSILLLRSFSDDKLRVRTALTAGPLLSLVGARMSMERSLAQMLLGEGELVAIGRPGERLPRLGAARTYWPDDQWQQAVQQTAAAAQAVVLICGSTAGLSWEIGHLREWGLLPKVLFVLPPLPVEEAQSRLDRLLNDLDLPESAFEQANECVASTVTAVQVTLSGRLAFYLCDGRDWAAYMGAVVYFMGELSGKVRPPGVGELGAAFEAGTT